jgi:hypothetical protein
MKPHVNRNTASGSGLQLVLFDLDDTLFDHQQSRRCGLLTLQRLYPSLALIPIDDLIAEHERQIRESFDRVLDGAVFLRDNRLERFRRLCTHFGIEMSSSAVESAHRSYREAYEEHRQAQRSRRYAFSGEHSKLPTSSGKMRLLLVIHGRRMSEGHIRQAFGVFGSIVYQSHVQILS